MQWPLARLILSQSPTLPGSADHGRGSELLDVAGGDLGGRVRVALNIALGAVAQPTLQLVGIGAGHLGQVEGEGVAQVVGPQGREPSRGIVSSASW